MMTAASATNTTTTITTTDIEVKVARGICVAGSDDRGGVYRGGGRHVRRRLEVCYIQVSQTYTNMYIESVMNR